MRNYLSDIRNSFSSKWRKFSSSCSSCLSCLNCFGSPKINEEISESGVIVPDSGSNLSAQVVFISQIPRLNPHALDNQESQSSDPKNLKSQTQTLEAQTQTFESESISQKPASIDDSIIAQQTNQIQLLLQAESFNALRILELSASKNDLERRLNLLEADTLSLNYDYLDSYPRMLSPILYQDQPNLIGLQDFSNDTTELTPQTESSLSRILNINIFSDIDYTEKGDEKISELLKSLSDASDPNFSSIMAKMGNDLKGVNIDDVRFSPSSSPYNSSGSSNKNSQPKVLPIKAFKFFLNEQFIIC